MGDLILALAVIGIFAFVLFFMKKLNYFLGKDRKVIDMEQDDDDDSEVLISRRFLNKKGKD